MSRSPLHTAIEIGSHGVITALLSYKANPNETDEVSINVLFHLCFASFVLYTLTVIHLIQIQLTVVLWCTYLIGDWRCRSSPPLTI